MPEQNADEEPPEGRARRGGLGTTPAAVLRTGRDAISAELALTLFRQMVRTRALEERSIKMSKSGEAFFWIGGPGEEAFNVCLGRQLLKGRGPAFDYVHLHYRNAGVMLAMGMSMTDHVRQLAMRATDRHSRGRNFVGHYCVPEWNVVPVTSVIEVQYTMAPGTALVQKRHGGEGITVVVGGDAGTAEGDFESCLNWSTQPGNSLPVLMVVTNNKTGISTPFETVHTRRPISDRALPYSVDSATVDGTDPVVVWHALDRAMRVCRRERKPFLLEVMVSRMHGHSSSSGAQRDWNEADPVALFEQRLIDARAIDADGVRQLREEARAEADAAVVAATSEPPPALSDLYRDTFAPSPVDAVYPGDYTGLPRRSPSRSRLAPRPAPAYAFCWPSPASRPPRTRPMRTLFVLAFLAAASPARAQDYRKDVQPLLRERCYACHGVLQQKAKLRLDTAAAMTAAGAVVPGKAADSELIARVAATDDTRMPPEGHALTAAQVAKLRAWIDAGAKAPADDRPEPDPRDHWAFRPVVRPNPPAAGNPIDAFVKAGYEKHKLTPVGPAEKRVLLRRVYLDLIGLPPTPAQADAFETDTRPDAYERVVDQLLASPQYGERWARHFLDIWRYSDWWGLGAELRNSQRHVWQWRDWAVESFNADLGYDEMVRQMLAADELYPTDAAKLRATGYLARPYFLFNRTTWLDEVVEHTGKGLMGLTTNCAKCHDHKYDPVSQADYYRLRAVFEPYQLRTDLTPELDDAKAGLPRAFDAHADAKTPFHVRGDERNPDKDRVIQPGVPRFLAPAGLKIEPVSLPLLAYQPGLRPEIAAAHVKKASTAADAAKARLAAARKGHAVVGGPSVGVLVGLEKAAAAADAHLAAAREFEGHAKAGTPAPAALALRFPGAVNTRESNLDTEAAAKARSYPPTSTGRRSALARWLTDRSNPLAARVAVNHVWLRHFGQPLVPTVFDLGRKGTAPTHPELLDWLAAEFMEHGWSFKHLHRVIVTSNVYRLSSSSKGAEASAAIDPENRYLWRMNPQRMTAQTVRDSLLHLAGDLDLTRGGPPVPLAEQDTSRRRAMYFFQSHNDHHKLLSIFDDANVLDCYRRTESVVPQQALALWNSKFAIAAAAKITERIPAADDAAFAKAAFETVLGTTPTADERAACVEGLADLRAANATGTPADRTRRARGLLVQALVNHNDFVTVR